MNTVKVITQAELNKALADPNTFYIDIVSPRGVWLEISNTTGKSVTAYGSASVRAYGSASVRAYGSASVTAYGSASVRAYDSASVTAYGSASVRAYGSASVTAYGSASVTAYGSASVRAYDSASVRAYDSASVRAYDSASVTASGFVAIHLLSKRVTVEGGQVIDITDLDLSKFDTWASYHGVEIIDGEAIVYKAVDKDLKSGRRFEYPIGEYVEAPDWNPGDFCGNGLHFSPWPHQALNYFPEAKRFLKVAVKLEELTVIEGNSGSTPKLKAKGGRVLNEVNIDAKEIKA